MARPVGALVPETPGPIPPDHRLETHGSNILRGDVTMQRKTRFRSVPAAILGALLLTLVGFQPASAEYVENVDCGSDEEVSAAIEKCFEEKLENCPEKHRVAAGCRNNKQYCTCTKKAKKKKGDKDNGKESDPDDGKASDEKKP
jgi:hypothetical protein